MNIKIMFGALWITLNGKQYYNLSKMARDVFNHPWVFVPVILLVYVAIRILLGG